MAWHGWKTIGEAQRYIEEANKIRLADSAAKLIMAEMRTKTEGQVSTPKPEVDTSGPNSLKTLEG
jgi:hypothetical protein